jgi:hypothetical protein
MKTFTSKSLEVPEIPDVVSRADLIFYDVDHSGPSYEARVFVDNSNVDARTPLDPEHGYVGSFTIFGHAGCFGDEGHCLPDSRSVDAFDRRAPHPLTPFTRSMEVTEAVKETRRRRVRVTVLPVISEVAGATVPDIAPVGRVRLVTYQD